MASKTLLLLGVAFTIVVLISSEAAARDLGEASKDEVEVARGADQYGGGGGWGHGGGGWGHGGGGGQCYHCHYGCCRYGCCHKAGEATVEVEPHN